MNEFTSTCAAPSLPRAAARVGSHPAKSGLRRKALGGSRAGSALDAVGASICLGLALPLLGLIALAIRLEGSGPILYRQVRLGRDRRPFRMAKFRTMRAGAEASTGPVWAVGRDPRVTRVGSILRPTHLDELPQLWNVIRGEMSLIGPRPERPELYPMLEARVPRYAERLRVRPGITGLAQVRCGYDSSLRCAGRKVKYDLYHIRRRSLRLDVWILAATVREVLCAGGDRRATRTVPS